MMMMICLFLPMSLPSGLNVKNVSCVIFQLKLRNSLENVSAKGRIILL